MELSSRIGGKSELDLGSRIHDFEDSMHPGQLEDLLHLRLRMQQANRSLPGASRFMKCDQRPQAATVNEGRVRKIHVYIFLPVGDTRAHPIAKSIRVGRP